MKKLFPIRSAKKIFHSSQKTYLKKKKTLDSDTKKQFDTLFSSLKEAIQEKQGKEALEYSKALQSLTKNAIIKSPFEKFVEFVGKIGFALVVAILVRQMWFELYRIPSGSMRPTLKEGDFLVVSKSDYGINFPLKNKHIYFDDSLIKRGDIVIFSGENMDIPDVDTMYFYIFPGKKQYVKRLIGKPGDVLYFYGGLVYGIDKEGTPLNELNQSTWFKKIEHIPMIRFEDKVVTSDLPQSNTAIFYQMNHPIAALTTTVGGPIQGKMYADRVKDYFELWGMGNYAMTQIVTKNQVPRNQHSSSEYYLKLVHHPSIKNASIDRDSYHRIRPSLSYEISYLPLNEEHLRKIAQNIYTSRFQVKDKTAVRYGISTKHIKQYPFFPKIDLPNGTYEIDHGVAYKKFFGDILHKLPVDNILYAKDAKETVKLYNLGIDWDTHLSPQNLQSPYFPSRYAYFLDGDLYLMGAPIILQNDPILQDFVAREMQKKHPFVDQGPPITKEGNLDIEKIRKFGLEIPSKSYLVLGDNHSLSGDSRVFGFVPESNIKGSASFLLWPPSHRWGKAFQPPSSFLTTPNLVVWSAFIICISLSYIYYKRKKRIDWDK